MPALAGSRAGQLLNPVRRLPLEARHRALGAVFDDYGGWLRPAFYGEPGGKAAAVEREVRIAREAVAIFDGSPLGKIEVIGPDAAAFLDFNSYMTMSSLQPGRIRYGLMLQENGVVFDDGVVARLDAQRFIVSCSTGHVAGVHARLEDWRQDQFDPSRLYVHNATAQWTTLTVSGPLSLKLVERLDLGVDLADAALPHMALAHGRFAAAAARVARVSFTGDRSYEISRRRGARRSAARPLARSGTRSRRRAPRRRGADDPARREGLLRRRQGHRRHDDAARPRLRRPTRKARRRFHRQAVAVHRSRQRA